MRAFLVFLICFTVFRLGAEDQVQCFDGRDGAGVPMKSVVESVPYGGILFIGELHGFQKVAEAQIQLLEGLRERGHVLHVAMEFFSHPYQGYVDAFRLGSLVEPDFLRAIEWGASMSFDPYRKQTLFADGSRKERTLAINATRALTRTMAKKGRSGLSTEESLQLPPHFELGTNAYRTRFQELMEGGHIDGEGVQRYFEAQSLWDDTMAWKLAEAAEASASSQEPAATQVVVVGEFHVQYGGGLPYRVGARRSGVPQKTLSLINRWGRTPEEMKSLIEPHPRWGQRADYICALDLGEEGGLATRLWSPRSISLFDWID